MNQNGPRRVYVAQPEGSPLSETDLLQVLSSAEIDLGTVRFVKTPADTSDIRANDALVLVLFDDQGADATQEAASLSAARAGSLNIVGLWAPGQTQTGIHPAVAKYATGQSHWDAAQLKGELGSDCENAFLTPTGDEADPNEVEPNECE